ncbi:SMI1/KNR4 family protein [Priestia megaterium]|uniref:SMI1/KNR4 family protein n=1 Tax=Priestia megaterium TaxID=1404 RepID=UPI0027315C24|nr:SMI1/KNR4 family protein [Priestia megaterium]MDP1442134.1 SMI1/KNR4 family protein [Priestia megaterium]MDP1471089.1 SMI1/KNR4 family protein [Priestia megaterium]
MWKDLIRTTSTECVFEEPASMEDIAVLEKLFNIQIPDELKTLLCETNGTNDSNGNPIIWSTEQIIRENLNLGERIEDTYILFNNLLFVAGDGDMFGYSTSEGVIKQNNIYVWNYENNRRKQVATSLKKFIEGRINRKLSI